VFVLDEEGGYGGSLCVSILVMHWGVEDMDSRFLCIASHTVLIGLPPSLAFSPSESVDIMHAGIFLAFILVILLTKVSCLLDNIVDKYSMS